MDHTNEDIDYAKQLDRLDAADPEYAHFHADGILLDALRTAGMTRTADAWQRARSRNGFWYA